jgi:hypothetical protein
LPAPANVDDGAKNSVLRGLPIREVTIFKDGHAFVLHSGRLQADARGQVTLDELPLPILGTFWPTGLDARLQSATAVREKVARPRAALSVREMLKANVGADITVIEPDGKRYDARILSVPELEAEAEAAALDAARRGFGSVREEVILLQTAEGVRASPLASIQNVIFKKSPRLALANDEFRGRLRLQLDARNRSTNIGVVYLQRGLRWIPGYRLALDAGGKATESKNAALKMQATLVNELADLENVAAHLVVGVPSFAFKDTLDPLALAEAFARVAPGFDSFSNRGGSGGGFGGGLSNSIQTQVTSGYRLNDSSSRPPNDGPSVGEGAANEDFFLFDVKNLSLKKGERSVFSLGQSEAKYRDVFIAQSPAAPPPDVYRSLSYEQQQAANTAARAQVMHTIRLSNIGRQPLTTAPLLIERNGRLLAQTMMTYTAVGGQSDISLAPAVDITVKREEDEQKRTPKALRHNDYDFSRVDVAGKLVLTSFRSEPVTVEVTRQFIGSIEKSGAGASRGEVRRLGAGDDEAGQARRPDWWNSGNGYWREVNPLSSVTWSVTLPAKGTRELPYEYFYYWR